MNPIISKGTLQGLAAAIAVILVAAMVVAYSIRGPSFKPGICTMPEDAMGTFVRIDGGGFIKGANPVYPEEGRPTRLYVSPFLIQVHEVTNDQFAAFVAATGYVTEAENGGGSAQFVKTETPQNFMSWWRLDDGATWKTPDGAGSNLQGKGKHPVVHVTLRDARAYAEWAGGRIPTEIEWEFAASLGTFDSQDPESGIRSPSGIPRANTWDGVFPTINTEADGFAGRAPVGCYEKNRINLYDMLGNVWEWTDSRYSRTDALYTIKGGSYLCSPDHCRRYRAPARQGLEPDFSTAHVGFRIVKDVER